ncbi:MAG TPA: MFS transporter [Verrucomicrobiae bacterium]|jgi:PAT family beta-lactamase induction signal transducer AmpG|nr:MFS transporter [Verrucomicrobiae bacterium]
MERVEFREAPVDNEGVSPHKHRLADYLRPKTLSMLLLGFSSGLPFFLVGNTFGYWLRDEHTSLTAIGFSSWVGTAYLLKFLWAPVMDRVDLPLFKRLGRRRGWMMFSQIVVGLALCAMGGTGTKAGLGRLIAFAMVVALASATQDIVVDAWRIESADDGDEQSLFASAYQFSYHLALLTTDSLILIVAAAVGWRMSYGIYGACMAVGMIATWFAKEPERADAVMLEKQREAPLWTPRGFFDAVVGPFIAFFRAHGWLALVMLAAISLYRLPSFIMGPMANPYYHDLGLTKQTVGAVRGSIGLIATFAGIAAGGFCSLKFGYMRALVIGGILQAAATAAFAALAFAGVSLPLFALVMAGDNFGINFAAVVLVAYMSSLTNLGYTATQYALLSSTYVWWGKILKGFSGAAVESLSTTHGLIHAYGIFFIVCGLTGVPAVLLFAALGYWHRRKQPAPAAA